MKTTVILLVTLCFFPVSAYSVDDGSVEYRFGAAVGKLAKDTKKVAKKTATAECLEFKKRMRSANWDSLKERTAKYLFENKSKL